MRYFTPELYEAMQACDSPAAAREANARWERAAQQYHAQLTHLAHWDALPGDIRRVIKLGSLHDAEVREIGATEGRRLVLVLKEVNRLGTLLLTYSLVDEPAVLHGAFSPEHQSLPRTWLYDELAYEAGITHEVTHAGREGRFPVFSHSILLSDGVELRLRFYRLEVLEIRPLLNGEQPVRREEGAASPTA